MGRSGTRVPDPSKTNDEAPRPSIPACGHAVNFGKPFKLSTVEAFAAGALHFRRKGTGSAHSQ